MDNTYQQRAGETICQHALRLLSNIPEKNWITGDFTDGKSKCCAIGHYTRLVSDPSDFSFHNCSDFNSSAFTNTSKLRDVTNKALLALGLINPVLPTDIATINNGTAIPRYSEPSKKRVLHFLNDAIEKGF